MVARIVHQLDSTLHEKSKLSIATALHKHGLLSFTELKNLLGMTDGNLCVHVRTLERRGYLDRQKNRKQGKTHTVCRLSDAGRQALEMYLDQIEVLVRRVREQNHGGGGGGDRPVDRKG